MSYDTIVQGLEARLRTVAGVHAVLDYEPTHIVAPTIISVLDSFDRTQSRGQMTVMVYRTIHTLAIPWQDNDQAERQLRSFINSVCAAIDTDPTLGGACANAMIASGSTGFVTVSSVTYRVVDFVSVVTEKKGFQNGI